MSLKRFRSTSALSISLARGKLLTFSSTNWKVDEGRGPAAAADAPAADAVAAAAAAAEEEGTLDRSSWKS